MNQTKTCRKCRKPFRPGKWFGKVAGREISLTEITCPKCRETFDEKPIVNTKPMEG